MNSILKQKLEELADASFDEEFLKEAWTDKNQDKAEWTDEEVAKMVRDDDGDESSASRVKASSHGDKSKQTAKKSPGNKNDTEASKSKEKYRSDTSTTKVDEGIADALDKTKRVLGLGKPKKTQLGGNVAKGIANKGVPKIKSTTVDIAFFPA